MTIGRSKAFKYRGASNALLKYIDKLRSSSDSDQTPRELWVFTHSSGNFAQAVSVLSALLNAIPLSVPTRI
jgi:threonine dehydratase